MGFPHLFGCGVVKTRTQESFAASLLNNTEKLIKKLDEMQQQSKLSDSVFLENAKQLIQKVENLYKILSPSHTEIDKIKRGVIFKKLQLIITNNIYALALAVIADSKNPAEKPISQIAIKMTATERPTPIVYLGKTNNDKSDSPYISCEKLASEFTTNCLTKTSPMRPGTNPYSISQAEPYAPLTKTNSASFYKQYESKDGTNTFDDEDNNEIKNYFNRNK